MNRQFTYCKLGERVRMNRQFTYCKFCGQLYFLAERYCPFCGLDLDGGLRE